jgi:hypothetical protein
MITNQWHCTLAENAIKLKFHHDTTEILLKVALNTIKPNQTNLRIMLWSSNEKKRSSK